MAAGKEDNTALKHAMRLTISLLQDPVPTSDCDEMLTLLTALRNSLAALEIAYAENCLFAKPTPTEDTQ